MNTCYSVYTFDEGSDYSQYRDRNLEELLTHMKAISEVLKRYHDLGYLYLDMKPENVFVIPETAEHVMLFDFDSVVDIRELRGGVPYRISYSLGYSAPEQVQGRRSQIGMHTDLYAIGAMLFAKLFGRLPKAIDASIGKVYNFSDSAYAEEIQIPKLKKLLSTLLKKTLVTSESARFRKADDVIALLNEMLPLANPQTSYVVDNFTYNEKNFVGRYDELDEIRTNLKHVLFLSGIGGIGKTELARRYAYEERKKYDTIVFLRYDESIVKTIASDDLLIRNYESSEENSEERRYRQKMDFLKESLTESDLVILDNFDTDNDEHLEEFLSCHCRFIITSRENFEDYNFEQISVGSMNNPEEAIELFYAYNDCDYSEKEEQDIANILELVEYHTMTITLIAKYLRDSGESPEALLRGFMQKEGVTSTDNTPVKHRKDRKLSAKRVREHLRTLFDFSGFSRQEKQVLMSLSLFGPVRILKELYLRIVDDVEIEQCLDTLIRRGWVESVLGPDERNRISLHQIVMDLSYNDMVPSTENCKDFTNHMIRYFQSKERNSAFRMGKEKLGLSFIDRVNGSDYRRAEAIYSYIRYVRFKRPLMVQAEEICRKQESAENARVLALILALRIRRTEISCRSWEIEGDAWKTVIQQLDNTVAPLIEESLIGTRRYIHDNPSQFEIYGNAQMELSDSISECANNFFMANLFHEDEGLAFELKKFYIAAEKILLSAYDDMKMHVNDYSFGYKEKLLLRLIEFY